MFETASPSSQRHRIAAPQTGDYRCEDGPCASSGAKPWTHSSSPPSLPSTSPPSSPELSPPVLPLRLASPHREAMSHSARGEIGPPALHVLVSPEAATAHSVVSSTATSLASPASPLSASPPASSSPASSASDDASLSCSFSRRMISSTDDDASVSSRGASLTIARLNAHRVGRQQETSVTFSASRTKQLPRPGPTATASPLAGPRLGTIIASASPANSSEHNEVQLVSTTGASKTLEAVLWTDLTVGSRLGSGGFGEVWTGFWGATPVAIKRLSPKGEESQQVADLVAEASVLASLSHPNIVQLLAVCTDAPNLAIVTELMESGDLHAALFGSSRHRRRTPEPASSTASASSSDSSPGSSNNKSGGRATTSSGSSSSVPSGGAGSKTSTPSSPYSSPWSSIRTSARSSFFSPALSGRHSASGSPLLASGQLSDRLKLSILHGVACGMEYLHRHGILHCDLKPRNILLSRGGSVVKVADFGLAVTLQDDETRGFAGTPRYAAPEVIMGDAPTAAADVFSFGVLLYETATQMRAFGSVSRIKNCYAPLLPRAVLRSTTTLDADLPDVFHSRLFRMVLPLIVTCIAEDPVARPSFADLAVAFASLEQHAAQVGQIFPSVPPLPDPATSLARPDLVRTAVRLLTQSVNVLAHPAGVCSTSHGASRSAGGHKAGLLLSAPAGAGKTWLATHVAHNREVGAAFVDGIHWFTLGAHLELSALYPALARELGIKLSTHQQRSIKAAREALTAAIASASLLLVLDNLSSPAELALCDVLSAAPRSRLLITARSDVAPMLRGPALPRLDAFALPPLSDADARALLALAAACPINDLPPEADPLLVECESLPIALSLVGAVVAHKRQSAWKFALDQVTESKSRGLSPLRMATALTVRAMHALRFRFLDLQVLPTLTLLPIDPLVVLWGSLPEPLSEYDIDAVLDEFARHGLVRLSNPSTSSHAVLAFTILPNAADYLAWEVRADTRRHVAAHAAILDAYKTTSKLQSWVCGPVTHDAYYRQHTVRHLLAVNALQDAIDLVTSFEWYLKSSRAERDAEPWLSAGADGLASYLADLGRVVMAAKRARLPVVKDLLLLRELFSLSRSALLRYPSMVGYQFLGRLWPVPDLADVPVAIARFVDAALVHKSRGHLLYVPRTRLLTAHGGAMDSVLRSHPHPIHDVVSLGGPMFASLCADSVCVWDISAEAWHEYPLGFLMPPTLGGSPSPNTAGVGGGPGLSARASSGLQLLGSDGFLGIVADGCIRIFSVDADAGVGSAINEYNSYTRGSSAVITSAALVEMDDDMYIVMLVCSEGCATLRARLLTPAGFTPNSSPACSPAPSGLDGAGLVEAIELPSGLGYVDVLPAREAPLAAVVAPQAGIVTVVDYDVGAVLFHATLPVSVRIADMSVVELACDGTMLAVASPDRILLWTTENDGSCLFDLANAVEPMVTLDVKHASALQFVPESTLLLVSQPSGHLCVASTASGRMLGKLRVHVPTAVTALSAAKVDDRYMVVSGDADGVLGVWSASGLVNQLSTMSLAGGAHRGLAHRAPVTSLAVHPDGSLVVTGSSDRTLRVYSSDSQTVVAILVGHSSRVIALTWMSKTMLASIDDNGTVAQWHVSRADAHMVAKGALPTLGAVGAAVWLGTRIFVGFTNVMDRIPAVQAFDMVRSEGGTGAVLDLPFVHGFTGVAGSFLAAASCLLVTRCSLPDSTSAVVHNTSTLKPVARLEGLHFAPLTCAHMLEVASRVFVATGALDNSVVVWDARSGAALCTLTTRNGTVAALRLFTFHGSPSLHLAVADTGRSPGILVVALRAAALASGTVSSDGDGEGEKAKSRLRRKAKSRRRRKGKSLLKGTVLEELADATMLRVFSRRIHQLDAGCALLEVCDSGASLFVVVTEARTFHHLTSLAVLRDAAEADQQRGVLETLWHSLRSAWHRAQWHENRLHDSRAVRNASVGYLVTHAGQSRGQIAEQPVSLELLRANAVVVVKTAGRVYVWRGPRAPRRVMVRAITLAQSLTKQGRRMPLVILGACDGVARGVSKTMNKDLFAIEPPYDALWRVLVPPESEGNYAQVAQVKAADELRPVSVEWLRALAAEWQRLHEVCDDRADGLVAREVARGVLYSEYLSSSGVFLIGTLVGLWVWVGDDVPEGLRAKVLQLVREMDNSAGSGDDGRMLLNTYPWDAEQRPMAWQRLQVVYDGSEPVILRSALSTAAAPSSEESSPLSTAAWTGDSSTASQSAPSVSSAGAPRDLWMELADGPESWYEPARYGLPWLEQRALMSAASTTTTSTGSSGGSGAELERVHDSQIRILSRVLCLLRTVSGRGSGTSLVLSFSWAAPWLYVPLSSTRARRLRWRQVAAW
ncbi:serine/threonine protein kinase [Thecamonas trahens ATCC 50062]|uniref:Serine/threonine protein kinase n=1 Tax=Thecamonas trahens ATCC 50062 TaxID=461836 RepID=A0A0L0DE84_THETB|nr:serine/threonine protein kinase [Thecamonas trahens ATCC 50062]KNC50632.1 serine/threonine protein kinase [Thecamonas trahens ATCC 50062]|eukprot:XP_013762518.1 serine/threonine protein kinase [Thecamonas trahens ATCC 50062]